MLFSGKVLDRVLGALAGFRMKRMLEQMLFPPQQNYFEHCTRAIKDSPVPARGSNQRQESVQYSAMLVLLSVYFVCQCSFLIWTASSVSGGLPHWQFRFFLLPH